MKQALTKIAKQLGQGKMTLAVCESCTGGMLSSMITGVPGCSKFFKGGIIAYSNKVKEEVAGVKRNTLTRHGAVSANTALEMAGSVRKKMKSDIGVGITGIAGPGGGTKKKPVGLVFIAYACNDRIYINRCLFRGRRDAIRKKACCRTISLLGKILREKTYRDNLH